MRDAQGGPTSWEGRRPARRGSLGARAVFVTAGFLMASGCAGPDADPPAESGPASQSSSEVAEVTAVVEAVLHAITTANAEGRIGELVLPDAQIVAVREGGVSTISGAEFAPGISDPEQGYVERMWDPEVRVQGPIASVWAPYDFYIHGDFSHCGVDAFQLVRDGGAWKVKSLVYNVLQPPACDMHPEGPPSG